MIFLMNREEKFLRIESKKFLFVFVFIIFIMEKRMKLCLPGKPEISKNV